MATDKEKTDYTQLKKRLKANKLTADDIRKLEELVARAETDEAGTVGGRRIVARLPHGMDVVK